MPAVADTPDIRVENHGSVVLLALCTEAAREWAEEHMSHEGFQPYLPEMLVVEPRYLNDIVAGAREAGLEVS